MEQLDQWDHKDLSGDLVMQVPEDQLVTKEHKEQ